EGAVLSTVRNLWTYMWPADRPDLRRRALLAIGALMLAKVASTLVPFSYKGIIDALDASGPDAALILGLSVPVILVIAYGIGQIVDTGFQQLRDILFSSVGQHAVRQLAYRTFTHVHRLSLRFHLQRKTGGLSRVIERGTKGIETIVRFTMLNTAPTLVEFLIVGVIFGWLFGWAYVLVLAVIVVLYMVFTVRASNWRIAIRRDMNESDTDANAKAVDSLLNFETVKYFGNEALEARRFDSAMAGYERAAVRIWAALGVMRGDLTVGDFVLLNTFLMQIYRPLNQIGFVYREIRQGLADIEAMFRLLDQSPEIEDKPDAQPLALEGPVLSFEDVYFH